MLLIKQEAFRQSIIDNRHIREYILRNHETWCTYAIDGLGLQVQPHEVIFVSGWMKTSSNWMATAFTSSSSRIRANADGIVPGTGGISMEYRKKYSSVGIKLSRQGAGYDISEGPKHDQCIFLRRYVVKKRLLLPKKIAAAAIPRPFGSEGGGNKETAVCCSRDVEDDYAAMDPVRSLIAFK